MTYRQTYFPAVTSTHLVDYVDGVTAMMMRDTFGSPTRENPESERGYDGEEWVFSDARGTAYVVYSRWGNFRIGAAVEDVSDFKAWLIAQLGVL